MAALTEDPDCSVFLDIDDLRDYARKLRTETSLNPELLDQCQNEVCSGLWGTDSSAISGVGIAAALVFNVALAFTLAVLVFVLNRPETVKWWYGGTGYRIRNGAIQGLHAYFDWAVYLAMAIQITVTILLARKGGAGAGGTPATSADLDTQLALVASVVCLLPLLYPIALTGTASRDDIEQRKKVPRALLFFVAILLFIYPFISQCIHNWELAWSGNGGEFVLSPGEWSVVRGLCFGEERHALSSTEHLVLIVFEMVASLVLLLFALWKVAGALPVSRTTTEGSVLGWLRWFWTELVGLRENVKSRGRETLVFQVFLMLVPVLLAVPLLWGIFRVRDAQLHFSRTTGIPYVGNEWGLGQTLALVGFLPVLVEMVMGGAL